MGKPTKKVRVVTVDGYSYQIGDSYEIEGKNYVFRGRLPKKGNISKLSGFFFDENEDPVILDPFKANNPILTDTERNEPRKSPSAHGGLRSPDHTNPKPPSRDRRWNADEIISFEPYPEDDEMVAAIKAVVNNDGKITITTASKALGHSAYNLLYGLRFRHTMHWASAKQWGTILGRQIEFRIVPK